MGHLGPQGADIHVDGLTANHAVEVKSSRRSAKNPGHNVTRNTLKKLHHETKRISEEFNRDMRAAYAVHIADAGGVMWAVPEKWFFRYLIAHELLTDRYSVTDELLDEMADTRINENCAARHR